MWPSMNLATNPSTISYFHYFWFTLLPFFLWCCLFKGDTISSKGRETSAAAFPLLVYDCVARRRKQSGSTVGGYAAAFSVKPFHYVLVVALKTFTWSMTHYFHYFLFLWAPIISQKFFLALPFWGFFRNMQRKRRSETHKNLRPKKGPESGYVSAKASWRRINMQGCSLSTKHQSKKDRESNFVHDTFLKIIVQKVYLRQISILTSNK